ncbi:Protease 4 [Thalassovita gelatinovora]|uniref:Protease 4 n=1 Tax=Thalassovita gelatinovora TaxID=53501 RepID=A0A0P1FKK8_THAGE|nr:S49 family peptidase [Thalassovita gelatinovora]QIZ79068.1 S49 family peptidase [Thalassovita gelatinovora]CUH68679.1 Protease 4 [Thalassovita gelatinovora]SEQ56585.1 Peptidase family S49 [Thalassovita gelatinovora]
MTHENTHPVPQVADSIAARLGGQVVALDLSRSQAQLRQTWPVPGASIEQPAEASAGPVDVPRGERYGVSRRVAVMPIRGILTPDSAILEKYLGWATYQGIDAACAEIAANDDVAAIVIDMNSPGGLVLGLEGAARSIADLAAVKPVHVLVNPMAASAAYYLASQGSDITMTPGSEAGSIGTTRMSAWPVQPDVWGEQWGIHLSSHARAKNPDPTTDTGLTEIQRGLDEAEAQFLDAVARGRGIDRGALTSRLSVTGDEADGGAMFRAADAIGRGLADAEEARRGFYERVFSIYAPSPTGGGSRAMARTAKARAAMAQAISNT